MRKPFSASVIDEQYMQLALRLARRGLGLVAPNPTVGCVIISKDREIVGRGWTQRGGRPHAETEALARAKDKARGGTVYLTLEPCVHYGATSPCVMALIDANVYKVVVALIDPDIRVSGKGCDMLRKAGIKVVVGVCAEEALWVNRGFILKMTQQRPLVTLKIATSANGLMRTQLNENPWITCEASRWRSHMIRAEHDAILVGTNTLLVDNPTLDCRLPGMQYANPIPIVMNRRGRLPLDYKLKQSDRQVIICDMETPESLLKYLAQDKGITRIMLEGGAMIAHSFLEAGLVDEIAWFKALHDIDVSVMRNGQSDLQFMGIDHLFQSDKFLYMGEETWHTGVQKDILTFWRKKD